MLYAMKSIQGKRRMNEDSILVPEKGGPPLFAVFDGMGGHRGGDTASAMAARLIFELLEQPLCGVENAPLAPMQAVIEAAVNEANAQVFALSSNDARLEGMGTTMVLTLVNQTEYIAANVGDSRLYHFSAEGLKQITRDHSYVSDLVRAGVITREQAHSHPARNVITRALGTHENETVDYYLCNWAKDDILLLCSDGLYGSLDEREIQRTLETEQDLQIACDTLVENALYDGSTDNISVVLVKNREEE